MGKFLRKFLGLLIIMLSTSFVWGAAQNLSSEKQLLTFGFTKAANPTQLQNDAIGVINQTNRTVSVTVPYSTVVTSLKASFTSSEFSKVYYGGTPSGTLAVSNVTSWNYTNPVTLTVEAENKSYENYVVTVVFGSPSTENNMLTFEAIWNKNWTGTCEPTTGIFQDTVAGTFLSSNVTFPVPYDTKLDSIIVDFTISPLATCNITSGTAQDFDVDNNGVPEAKIFTVTSESGVSKNYNVLPVVGEYSVLDELLTLEIPGAFSVNINRTTQMIDAVVPFSSVDIEPVYTISPYAHMFADSTFTTEICSGNLYSLTGNVTVFNFWIRAEKPSEVSKFTLTVTKAPASTAASLLSINANYLKSDNCSGTYSGNVVGNIVDSTITFNVPFGVSSVVIHEEVFSPLATTSDTVGTVLNNTNNTIVITAENGIATKTYYVVINQGQASNNKKILSFGFNRSVNNSWGFIWADSTYTGTIDQNLKRISVVVPYNTNLYQLKAYFTKSTYSCVSIAESNGSYTPQVSETSINNFSNTLTYVVTAEDGTQERYEVTVTKVPAKTGNDLNNFQVSLFDCFGVRYNVVGVYSGNNISVSVKYGTDITELQTSFTISDGATVTPAAGIIDFTNPVNFTVTSEAGVSKVYTVTVNVRPENSEKKILSYWFDTHNNESLLEDVSGSINETAKTVKLSIPWSARNSINSLKPSFTISVGAVMTRNQVIQTSGANVHDFTTPLVFRVYAENCTYVDYFVTVEVTDRLDGDICETAVPLTLPVVNLFGTTTGFEHDYDSSPCSSEYMFGNDRVYTITIPYESYLTASIVGENGSIHILDACPSEELDSTNCKAFVGGSQGGELSVKIDEGTYYVVISSASPTQSFDYLLNMSYYGTGINNDLLETKLKVYPNPASDKITINITNQSAVDVKLQLINISGQVILYKELNNIQIHNEEIDVTSFAKGIYYLKVNDGKAIKFEKIIIE